MKRGVFVVDPGAHVFDQPDVQAKLAVLSAHRRFAGVQWIGRCFPEDARRVAERGPVCAPWVSRWEPLPGSPGRPRCYLPVIWPGFEFLREAQYVADHVLGDHPAAVIYPDAQGIGIRIEQTRRCLADQGGIQTACISFAPIRNTFEIESRFMDTAEVLALDWAQAEVARCADEIISATPAAAEWLSRVRARRRPSRPTIGFEPGAVDISVVIAHFNSVAVLRNQLFALTNQVTSASWEVLVVDDASSAASVSDLRALIREFHGPLDLRLIEAPKNGGPSAARNLGAAEARGTHLVFVDCDNESLPGMLNRLWTAIEASSCDVLTCYNLYIPSAPGETARLDRDRATHTYAPLGMCGGAAVLDNFVGDANAIVRRNVFRHIGGFSEQHISGEDHEFFVRAALAGFSLSVIPEPLFLYRGAASSYSTQSGGYRNRMRTVRATAEYFQDCDDTLRGLLEMSNAVHSNLSRTRCYMHAYKALAGLPDDLLMQWLDGRSTGSNDTYIQPMLQRLRPLLLGWEINRTWPQQVFIYGAGEHSKVMLALFPELHRKLTAFIDSCPRDSFLERPVIQPAQCTAGAQDAVIYSSRFYEHEMYARLRVLPCEHVLIYGTPDKPE